MLKLDRRSTMEQSADTHLGLAKKQLLQALQKLSAQENYEMAQSVLELLENLKAIAADIQLAPDLTKRRPVLATKERTLVDQGSLIEAVKELRARTDCGPKEAKDLCEAYRDRRPPPAG